MGKKKEDWKETAKAQSMIDNSRDSQNSKTGYLQRGNDASVQAKARTIRNNDNGSHM